MTAWAAASTPTHPVSCERHVAMRLATGEAPRFQKEEQAPELLEEEVPAVESEVEAAEEVAGAAETSETAETEPETKTTRRRRVRRTEETEGEGED